MHSYFLIFFKIFSIINIEGEKMDKKMFKMTNEELQQWLYLRSKTYAIPNKKGKGSYSRKDKYKNASIAQW